MIKIKNSKNKKITWIVAALVVAAITAILYVIWKRSMDVQVYDPSKTIRYLPASDEEKQQAEDNKSNAFDRMNKDETPDSTSGTQQNVKPSITYFGQQNGDGDFRVGSGVTNIYEDGGKCILTVTFANGTVVTDTRDAVKDAKSVSCGSLMIEKQRLVPGKASFTMKYESANYKGESDETEVILR